MSTNVSKYSTAIAEFQLGSDAGDLDIINKILTSELAGDAVTALHKRVGSHRNMMRIMLTALENGAEYGNLMMRLENWTACDSWIELEDKQYAWPLYDMFPELVSWDKLFSAPRPRVFYEMGMALAIPGISGYVDRAVRMLKFFSEYDFGSAFQESNPDVVGKIKNLNIQRACMFAYNCIDVWLPGSEQYFVAREPALLDPTAEGAGFWKSKDIASQRKTYKQIKPGDKVLVDKPTFEKRFFEDICKGMLQKSPNKELAALNEKFPFKNVVFSGSIIQQALDPDFDQQKSSDVDLFVIGSGSEERSAAFKKIIEWFTNAGNVFYAIKGGVVCIYVKDVDRQFQIINTNMLNGHAVVDRYDLSHIQFFVKISDPNDVRNLITVASIVGYEADYFAKPGLQVFGTYRAFRSQIMRTTNILNRSKIQTNRLVKALYRGFDIEYNNEIKNNVIDITRLIERPAGNDIQSHIRKLSGMYYPRSADSSRFADADEETQYILRMIEMEHGGAMVTADPSFVLENTTLNINFDVEYDSLIYSKFNINTIIDNGRHRGDGNISLRNKNGSIYMIGGICKIVDVSNEDGNVDIRLRIVDRAFTEFIKNTVERDVLRRFTPKALTKRVLTGGDEDTISMRFDRIKIEYRAERKDTCARTNKGTQISLEDDLSPNDLVSPMFQIRYIINDGNRGDESRIECILVPIKIIKLENDEKDNDETTSMNKSELSDGADAPAPIVQKSDYDNLDFE